MPPDLAELQRWLHKAENDRRSAEALLALTDPIPDTAAFHCHQAVEKLLKAYLFWHGIDFEKTHDLRALVAACMDRDGAFSVLEARVAGLTPFAVRFRYPGPADPSPEAAREALLIVEEVKAFVLSRLAKQLG